MYLNACFNPVNIDHCAGYLPLGSVENVFRAEGEGAILFQTLMPHIIIIQNV